MRPPEPVAGDRGALKPSVPAARLRLAMARTIAWTLWIAGWLLLGALGRDATPLWAGGMAGLAIWLLAIGALQRLTRPMGRRGLAFGLATGAAAAAGGLLTLAAAPGPALVALAVGWALLIVAASRCVRLLRGGVSTDEVASPLGPAVAGAFAAWLIAGDLPALRAAAPLLAALPVVAALVLPALLPRGLGAAGGCRAGLFDCALPWGERGSWRDPRAWPRQASLVAMLPMMAALPAMADWCGALGWPARTTTALHLAAMLAPAWLLAPALRRAPPRLVTGTLAFALVAGGLALVALPGLQGGMAASLAHAFAWGLAWGAPLAAGRTPLPLAGCGVGSKARARAPVTPALASAALLVALGFALRDAGPSALAVAHALIAAAALPGLWGLQRRAPGSAATTAPVRSG